MKIDREVLTLTIIVDPPGDGVADELDRATRQLSRAIAELPVHKIEPVRGVNPQASAKVVDPVTLGVLLVGLLPRVIPAFCSVLKEWIDKSHGHRLRVKIGGSVIDFTGKITAAQAEQMILLAAERNGSVSDVRSD